jgi:hypothetical protein
MISQCTENEPPEPEQCTFTRLLAAAARTNSSDTLYISSSISSIKALVLGNTVALAAVVGKQQQ